MRFYKDISNRVKLIRLKRAKRLFERENRQKIDSLEFVGWDVDEDYPPELEVLGNYSQDINLIETEKLRRLAEKWNIEIRRDWIELRYNPKGEELYTLSDTAVATIKETVRKKRREHIEWRIAKIIVPLIGVVTGLIGVIVALLALLSKN